MKYPICYQYKHNSTDNKYVYPTERSEVQNLPHKFIGMSNKIGYLKWDICVEILSKKGGKKVSWSL